MIHIRELYSLLLTLLLWVGSINFSISQNTPILSFEKDSFLIGEPIPVSFSLKHSPRQSVVFPDSSFDFTPFEYDHKDVFTTHTDSLSIDSVVYWLSCFEIEKLQTLKLPVFIYTKLDSIPIYSNTDSIYLTELIPVVSDTLQIKENTIIQEVDTELNYLLFSSAIGIILIILLLFVFLFRKRISDYFKMRRLLKNHEKFIKEFDDKINEYNASNKAESLEALTISWKSYLEKLLDTPFTKLSTKEIKTYISNEEIIEILKEIDGNLFGNIPMKNTNLSVLKDFAINKYTQITLDLKND